LGRQKTNRSKRLVIGIGYESRGFYRLFLKGNRDLLFSPRISNAEFEQQVSSAAFLWGIFDVRGAKEDHRAAQ
jgi:hypothetical protein